jgi:transcriptional regulator with PAS, ATPase and Fis domain
MNKHQWVQESSAAITVCDAQGIILEMNDQAAKVFQKHGGRKLVGSNVLDCHPETARIKIRQLMERQQTNIYTVENNGITRLIYQSPWYAGGKYSGFMEISFELPASMPHFIRDNSKQQLL